MRRVQSWDWKSPLRIAGTTLGVSFALALIFGLASRPASSQLHWGFKTTLAWVAWVWESIFGVDAVGSAKAGGSLDFFGSTIDGSASGSAAIGAMPLTLTVITLVATAIAFRRATASTPNAVSALFLGLRVAVLITIPLVVVSLLVSLNANDLINLVATSDAWQQWQSLTGDKALSVSLSSTDAALVPPALLLTLVAGLTLLRAEWFTGRVWSGVQLCLAAPLRAFGRLSIAVVLGGLLFELTIWLIRWNTSWAGGEHRPSLTAHQWVNGFASAIAYAGNAGAMALGLGSFGSVGYSTSATVSAPLLSGTRAPHEAHWIAWFAQADHLAYGVWIAVLIAPVMLLSVAWSVARMHGTDPRAVLTSLGTWLVSLVVAIPVLASVANLSIGGNGSADATFGIGGFTGHAEGSASAGLSTLVCTFVVFVYALIICAVIIARARPKPSEQDPAADTHLLSSPQ